MTPPSTRTPESSSQGARTLWHAANQDLLREGYFERSELRSDFAAAPFAGCDLFGATVQISAIESVKRHSKEQYGIVTESIYAPARSRIEICYEAPAHLLVLYEDGVRREGETSISELFASELRNFANKLTFVSAGHAYREWHETGAPLRVTYLYLDPTKLQQLRDTDAAYAPRTFFEDPILWATATKLKNVIERNQPESKLYFDALASVLAHELSRSGRELTRILPASRGGLASWQKRAVIGYIEEHLDERVSLVTLARLARLSQHLAWARTKMAREARAQRWVVAHAALAARQNAALFARRAISLDLERLRWLGHRWVAGHFAVFGPRLTVSRSRTATGSGLIFD